MIVVFGKLFGKKNENDEPRVLSSVKDVQAKDLIAFKARPDVPEVLRGETVEIASIATYQYKSSISTEFTLKTVLGEAISVSYSDDEDGIICVAQKIPRQVVIHLFGEEQFGELWGEGFVKLTTNDSVPENLTGWTASEYQQTEKEGVAFYINADKRSQALSSQLDDGSEEVHYHECRGGDDDGYGVNVEFWETGETDVYLCRTFSESIIEEYWPGG